MPHTHIFQCTMCGECCRGLGGIVVSSADVHRLAAYLSISEAEVLERYGEVVGRKNRLRSQEDGTCIFFSKTEGCTVHESKPAICQAWPFFRGNLLDPQSLAMAKEFCPGINPNVTHADFAQAGFAYLQKEHLVAQNKETEANALLI